MKRSEQVRLLQLNEVTGWGISGGLQSDPETPSLANHENIRVMFHQLRRLDWLSWISWHWASEPFVSSFNWRVVSAKILPLEVGSTTKFLVPG